VVALSFDDARLPGAPQPDTGDASEETKEPTATAPSGGAVHGVPRVIVDAGAQRPARVQLRPSTRVVLDNAAP
jgi:hypothetical protein